ncbi:SIR2 family NAD-dependent protein deacylase [Agrococcus lahaulensis]|uniref:SIR2 family NAD-dependent protein deacylase n=1 Tax=Agrococcus lahaulensis TaxID=341722 RepID=UPI00047DF4C7|nr:SIR2 family protein [Agrococcus lahaulensis]
MSGGHVFITMGDITHLECDAWLLPTDERPEITPGWFEALPELRERLARTDVASLRAGDAQAVPLAPGGDGPAIVLATVPLNGVLNATGVEHIETSVREFVECAAHMAAAPRHERSKRLLALPSFGTGKGGGAHLRGELAERLLDVCAEMASAHDVDLAIVLRDERSFARMQELRKRRDGWHGALTVEQFAEAGRLAARAKAGRLVPFLGAGTSISAGAPSWSQLLVRLGERIGLTADEQEALRAWGELDRAAFLRQRAIAEHVRTGGTEQEGAAAFSQAVVELVDVRRYGLAPALLASLRTPQAITLNYDGLFEAASTDVGTPRVTIPHSESGAESGPWLLKLHGSVDEPSSIVLTRDDYLGYATQREALSAIVKANLLTHHLLFVGFGLSDEHFHRIVHDVRRALPPHISMEERATALTLTEDTIASTLWRGQVRMLPVGSGPKDGRAVEVFLDVVVALATDAHSYLLADDFATSLNPGELRLRDALLTLRDEVEKIPTGTGGRDRVLELLHDFGGWDDGR